MATRKGPASSTPPMAKATTRSISRLRADDPEGASPSAARGFLLSQDLIDKKSTIITPGVLSGILSILVTCADVTSTVAALIESVVVLLPDALEIGLSHAANIVAIADKVDRLVELGNKQSELPERPDPSVKLLELEGKLEKLTQSVEKSLASAGAAETAAIETQRSLISFHEGLNQEADAGNGAPFSAPVGPSGKPPAVGPRPVSVKQAAATARRTQAQGSWITVQPKSPAVLDNLSTLNAQALVRKAEAALDIAWKVLAATSDFRGKARPRVDFRSARLLAKGGIRYDLNDRAQAAFLSDARVAKAFETAFGDVSCTGQGASILLQCAPVSWNPEDPEALRSLEHENQLELGTIVSASWVKPIHRRKPEQRQAVAKLWLRSQAVADDLIIHGGHLDCAPIVFRMIRPEPIRCLKCQRFGHKSDKCKATEDTCSGCGGGHRSKLCDTQDKKHCVNCKTDDHCAWDRSCPSFKKQRDLFSQHRPETQGFLYDATRESELTAPRHRGPFQPPATLLQQMIDASNRVPGPPAGQHGIHPYLGPPRPPAWGARLTDNARKQLGQSQPWDDGNVLTAPRQHDPVPHLLSRPVPVPVSSPSPVPNDPNRYTPSLPNRSEPLVARRTSVSSFRSDGSE